MLIRGRTVEEVDRWKQEMKQYCQLKRTNVPFGNEYPRVHHITQKQVKQHQSSFNPVLQTYKNHQDLTKTLQKQALQRTKSLDNIIKHQPKHQKLYDIINLRALTNQSYNPLKQKFSNIPLTMMNYNNKLLNNSNTKSLLPELIHTTPKNSKFQQQQRKEQKQLFYQNLEQYQQSIDKQIKQRNKLQKQHLQKQTQQQQLHRFNKLYTISNNYQDKNFQQYLMKYGSLSNDSLTKMIKTNKSFNKNKLSQSVEWNDHDTVNILKKSYHYQTKQNK